MNPENWLNWKDLLIYSPLGIIGAWRWSVWLWQKVIQYRYEPIPENHEGSRLSLSIVTPVYNEDPKNFRETLLSWVANDPQEIIAVIDYTDTECIRVFQEFASGHPQARLIVTEEPGKRSALAKGARIATGDIIALADSDTRWDRDIRGKLLAPFKDPSVGGVAPRQAILKADTFAKKLFSIRLDLRYLHEFRYLGVVSDALTCLSGRTALYRREALLPLLDDLVNETFLGQPCISGDDKQLTFLLQKRGWKVRYQQTACVRTPGMPKLITYLRQGLRWGRNSWRTDFRMLGSSWVWMREPLFGYHLFDRAVQPFTLLLGPIYLGVAIFLGHSLAASILITWWIVSRGVRVYPHLKEHPEDILFVPFYAVSIYPIAVLKIYALFTLDYQSWITRWDASRIRRLSFFRLLPSRLATVSVIGAMAFFITAHEYTVATEAATRQLKASIPYTQDFAWFDLEKKQQDFFAEREAHRFGTYLTRLGDTPLLLNRKFNLSPEKSADLFPGRAPSAPLQPGTVLTVPIDSLRVPLERQNIPALAVPNITYDRLTDTVTVKGKGSVVTIRDIASSPNIRRNPGIMTEITPKEWILRSNLYVSEGVTLIIDGEDVSWLKLRSDQDGFVRIRSYNGSVLIRDTKITSWNEASEMPDSNYLDGRAFVLAQTNGRMDVIDSEIAYLGFPRSTEIAQEQQRIGGIYGLSWKIPNGTFGRVLLTGVVIGNSIHDNYFGIYTFGATGMVIRDNDVFDNIQYGIDPHDDSNNLLIENNNTYRNGNHGIIVSKRVVWSDIRGNRSTDNWLHGIMLDRDSNYNLIEGNLATGNVNGIAISEAHKNLIRGNTFIGNRYGIRANNGSSENRFENNVIRRGEKGIFIYGEARDNVIVGNRINDNAQGISLKQTSRNIVIESLSKGANPIDLKLDENAKTSNFIQEF